MLASTSAFVTFTSNPVQSGIGVAEALDDCFPNDVNLTRYFLFDGGTLANLAERLGDLNVTSRPIFDLQERPNLVDSSPYLVMIEADNAHIDTLFDQWCRETNDGADPFALLDMRPGILLMSSLDIDQLRTHLRRLVMLPDEYGTHMFFRFQEPGMLYALLRAAPVDAQAAVLSGISRVIWADKALEDNAWRLRGVDQAVPAGLTPRLPKIDRAVRRSLAHAVNRQRARQIARDTGEALEKRIDIAKVVVRLLDAKHSGPDWLFLHFYKLLNRAPADWQVYWWARAEARTESLAVLNRGMHDHHGQGEFKP